VRARVVSSVVAALGVAAAPGTGRADPASPGVTFLMSGNPHVPFATVRGAAIESAVANGPSTSPFLCGDPQRWAKVGSAWHAVDAWGHVTGTYRIASSEFYDATGCREVSFAAPPADEGTKVYISTDSAWREPTSRRWTPSAAERRSFLRLARTLEKGQTHRPGIDDLPSTLTEIHEQTRFFEVPATAGGSTHMAIAGRCGGWMVAQSPSRASHGSAWQVVTRALQERPDHRECYRPLAVFDLDGDGTPEIVLRFIEEGGEWWGEQVIRRQADGTWKSVALGRGGSTA
jgi:hypothetical protein